jgi:hypothetical protein
MACADLDLVAIDGAPAHHHLEAVVVLGVVAARDLDAAGAQRAGGKVEHRRRHHADVNHFQARSDQPAHQCPAQGGAAQASIAANRHGGFALLAGDRAKRPADAFGHRFVHGGRHDAANVVCLEDGRGQLHGEIP